MATATPTSDRLISSWVVASVAPKARWIAGSEGSRMLSAAGAAAESATSVIMGTRRPWLIVPPFEAARGRLVLGACISSGAETRQR